MATYLIGDIHGCYDELQELLSLVKFNPQIDHLWLTGDIIARGPKSLEVMRMVVNDLGHNVHVVLGNHDLYLISIYTGINPNNNPTDNLTALLEAPDINELINWLRYQHIMYLNYEQQLLIVHAGISPQWELITATQCAREIEIRLQSNTYPIFIKSIYDIKNVVVNNYWSPKLTWLDKLRYSINVFTRIRYCYSNGKLELTHKEPPNQAPNSLIPWFSIIPSHITNKYSIVFGHWSSLIGYQTPPNIYGIDNGCYWGGKLTLLRWEDKLYTSVVAHKKNK